MRFGTGVGILEMVYNSGLSRLVFRVGGGGCRVTTTAWLRAEEEFHTLQVLGKSIFKNPFSNSTEGLRDYHFFV
jgi:hypothetical protein